MKKICIVLLILMGLSGASPSPTESTANVVITTPNVAKITELEQKTIILDSILLELKQIQNEKINR